MDELEKEIYSFIAQRVAEGFLSDEEIADEAVESFEEDYEAGRLESLVDNLTSELVDKHYQEQRRWNYDTDCDRLDNVFAELDANGIVARQNFSCCQNCGHSEIWDEIDQARAEQDVLGYVFYHMEDTERVCGEGILYLAYGAVDSGDEPALYVARQIVDALDRAGLKTDWNGSLEKRVKVYDFTWKKRRLRSLVH